MTEDVTEDSPQTSGFLAGLEFLTGEDPSAGSFLLVVGMVTCVFIAAFQFMLTPRFRHCLRGSFWSSPLSASYWARCWICSITSTRRGARHIEPGARKPSR